MSCETDPDQGFRRGWRARLLALKNIPPVMRMVWEADRRTVAAGLVLRVAAGLIPVGVLAVGRLIIDEVVRVTSTGQAPSPSFWWLVALEFALAGAATVLARGIDYGDSLLADKFTHYLSVRVINHAARLDLASYEDPVFYDKLERARVQAVDRLGMIQAVGRLAQQLIVAGTLSVSILLFSPWLLVILIAAIVPAFLGESHFAFLGFSLSYRQTPDKRQMDYLRVLGASKESAKELKLFGLASFIADRYEQLSQGIYQQNVALARRRFGASSLLSLASTAGYYGCYTFAVYEALSGRISVGTLTFLAGAIAGASSNLQMIFSAFSSIADQALYLTVLIDFFDTRPAIVAPAQPLPGPRPIRQGFEFDNVSFVYPGRERPVLDHLCFRLEPGERMALIGENGEGKTTIVKLLTRLYDPTGGRVLLDGIDLREYDIEDVRSQVGVIFQDFMRYEMSVTDNIAVGRVEEQDNLRGIYRAATKSLADEMIDRLPRRYEQMLGRRFEGGVDLSGGEWQKLALARAYLRDAELLILDEPTAALDARSEHAVFQRFSELTEGKMAVLISHRFSTVRMADQILVLEGGRIREHGTHSQLMALGGRYNEMFELQAASYR